MIDIGVSTVDQWYKALYHCYILNIQTIVDVFSMPDVKKTLDTLAHAKYFSVMNARASYWQVLIDPLDIQKNGITVAGA